MHFRKHPGRGHLLPIALSALMVLAGSASPTAAQQVSGGATSAVIGGFVRGVDTANDLWGNYLVVGGQGNLTAVCLNASGVPISGGIPINATPTGYASFPRAVYSPHVFGGAGGFMVVWAETPPGNPDAMRQLLARPVHCNGTLGVPQLVSPTVWWEPGNVAIGYSSASFRFLVAWQTPEHTVAAALLNLAGTPVSGPVPLSAGMGRDPSVTWNEYGNNFGVSFSGETYSALAVVSVANVASFSRNTFNVSGGILTTMTDVAFHPGTGRFVMTWYEISSGAFVKIAEFDRAGNLLASGVASTRLGSYDALSMSLNYVTGTLLVTGVDRAIDTTLGLELNARGFPFNGENTLSGTRPIRYPRVSANRRNGTWNVVVSGPNFGAVSSMIATSYAGGGGPGGSFDAPPAPGPNPGPSACPGTAPVPGWVCYQGNWLPPDHPALGGGGAPPPPPPPPPTSSCAGSAPVAGWVCVSGNWLPPDHPLAASAPPPPPPPPAPSSCTTVQPAPGWVCINGNWLPPDMACPTIQPGPNWRCVNGNWLPPQ
jgi:hypothetical protein